MHIFMKRFCAIIMTLALAIGCSASAFAAEPADVLSIEATTVSSEASAEASTRASLGDVIAAGSTTIYGGSGFLYVTLPTWNLWADIQAGIDYAPQNGLVTCTVVTPDGDEIYLGTISGSGSRTGTSEIGFAPAGTYEFYFSSANNEPFDVCGFIFD